MTFEAIGSHWSISIHTTIPAADWYNLQSVIDERIEQFDKEFSRFRADSWVTSIANQPGKHKLSADAHTMLSYYADLYKASGGLVTPLIGRLLEAAGYDAQYSLQETDLIAPPTLAEAISFTKDSIEIKLPVLLDFGAIGKGYLVDIVGKILQDANISSYVIDAGGDILHHGTSAIEVGLESPVDSRLALGTVPLQNRSLCASAGSRRAWGKYHHIINPSTQTSPTDVVATWVVADTTMLADGLATALFLVPLEVLQKRFSFSAAVLHKDMALSYTKDFPVRLFDKAAA